ncbi:MAG: DegV family protein [Caldicoprobacterales bacterium]|jgi:DegV family protein with EDD domain|nr:DegV family protein [Clostridiales bacterium]
MNYSIIADSCCDVSEEMKKETGVELVPLTLRIDDNEYVDDHTLDIKAYLKAMKESRTSPKTACPSIQDFLDRFRERENIFVVTLSSKLSGTYNSAMQAKAIILEEFKDKFIHVFDSMSAAAGETLVHLKIHEHLKNNLKNTEIVDKVTGYIKEMKTFFLLENLDNLSKSGRLNPIIAKAANLLSIKPIMGDDNNGTIRLVDKVRGYERAFQRLVDIIGEEGRALEEKILGIAHCNCLQRALKFKDEVMKRYNFKDIVVVEMAGVSTTYADQGGLVIAF